MVSCRSTLYLNDMIATTSKFLVLVLLIGSSTTPFGLTEQFITTTPCSPQLLNLHAIPPGADCSTIKWNLTLDQESGKQTFLMKSEWGYYIDNRTLEKRGSTVAKGTWSIEKSRGFPRLTIKTENGVSLSFRRLDNNHLHPLDENEKLLNGDGGWSFTLNKVGGAIPESPATPTITTTPFEEPFARRAFHGRTPCQEIAKEAKIPVSSECFKLKWLIRFYQDSITQRPTHYEMSRTQHRASVIKGKWKIYTTTINNRNEVIYELDPDSPDVSIRFMKGDDNVLFFLDKNFNLLPGGVEFGYTLNRR